MSSSLQHIPWSLILLLAIIALLVVWRRWQKRRIARWRKTLVPEIEERTSLSSEQDPHPVSSSPTPDSIATPRYWHQAPTSTFLLALIILVSIPVEILGQGEDSWALLRFGANFPSATLHHEPWRLISSMFLHGGLLHLAVNCYALYSLGRLVEQLYGSLRLWIIYMIAGMAGSFASAYFGGPYRISIGASGAIFGLLGAAVVVLLRLRGILPENWRKQAVINLVLVIGLNLYIGHTLPMVDNSAHLGGLLGGALMGLILVPRRPVSYSSWGYSMRRAFAALLALALVFTAVMVLITPPAKTLQQLPRQSFTQNNISVVGPAHWIKLKDDKLVLRDPLLRALIVEFDVGKIAENTSSLANEMDMLAKEQGEQLKKETEIRDVYLVSSPRLKLPTADTAQAILHLKLLNQSYYQIMLLRPQEKWGILVKILIPMAHLSDYQEILQNMAMSMQYTP